MDKWIFEKVAIRKTDTTVGYNIANMLRPIACCVKDSLKRRNYNTKHNNAMYISMYKKYGIRFKRSARFGKI